MSSGELIPLSHMPPTVIRIKSPALHLGKTVELTLVVSVWVASSENLRAGELVPFFAAACIG